MKKIQDYFDLEYTNIEGTSLKLSKVILGTWAIGGKHWGEYSENDAEGALKKAIELGINTIDTAPVYGNGQAEKLIGKVTGRNREKIIIATKCGIDINNKYKINLSPSFINEEIDNSLKRLNTNYIDIYQCHWPDNNTPLEKTLDALLELKNKGKIKYLGLSNHSNEDIEKANNYCKLNIIQHHYSILERRIENDITKTTIDKKISLLTYGSLGGGILTGKYKEWEKFNKRDVRYFFYKFFQKRYREIIKKIINIIEEIAEAHKTSPGNISLAWLLGQCTVTSIIVGAKNSVQVKENCKCINIRLTENELKKISTASNFIFK